MSDLIPYGEQFEKIVNIIESAKERAYCTIVKEVDTNCKENVTSTAV